MWARSNSSCLENLTEKSLNNILRDHSQSPSKRGANPGSWKRKRQHPSSPFARVISHIFLVSYPSGRHFPCSVLIPSLSRLSRDMVRAPACVCVCLKGRSFTRSNFPRSHQNQPSTWFYFFVTQTCFLFYRML